jgi:hypothetical protein
MTPKLKSGRSEHVFAIVRVDDFQKPEVSVDKRIAITKIVFDQESAEQEVKRLNDLSAGKRVHYFSQVTRLEKSSVAAPATLISSGPHITTAMLAGPSVLGETTSLTGYASSGPLVMSSTPVWPMSCSKLFMSYMQIDYAGHGVLLDQDCSGLRIEPRVFPTSASTAGNANVGTSPRVSVKDDDLLCKARG